MEKINGNVDTKKVNNFVDSIKQDPRVAKYNVTEENVLLFNNYLQTLNLCKGCKGLQCCKQDPTGFAYVVEEFDGKYSLKSKACKYKASLKTAFNSLNVPKSVLEASLDKFEPYNQERQEALKLSRDFIDDIVNKKDVKGFYLYGQYSVGKTYLMGSIANELAKNGISSYIVYFPDLVRELKLALNDGSLEEKIDYLYSVPVLFLDDLGAEAMTPWFRDEIFGPILQYRLGEKKPVFISTNLKATELVTHLAGTSEKLENVKATRIIERIKNFTTQINLGSEKYSK